MLSFKPYSLGHTLLYSVCTSNTRADNLVRSSSIFSKTSALTTPKMVFCVLSLNRRALRTVRRLASPEDRFFANVIIRGHQGVIRIQILKHNPPSSKLQFFFQKRNLRRKVAGNLLFFYLVKKGLGRVRKVRCSGLSILRTR